MTLDNQYGQKSILVAIPELLTARGVGAILGISAKTVHKLVREKRLGCFHVTACDRRFFRVLCRKNHAPGVLGEIESNPRAALT